MWGCVWLIIGAIFVGIFAQGMIAPGQRGAFCVGFWGFLALIICGGLAAVAVKADSEGDKRSASQAWFGAIVAAVLIFLAYLYTSKL